MILTQYSADHPQLSTSDDAGIQKVEPRHLLGNLSQIWIFKYWDGFKKVMKFSMRHYKEPLNVKFHFKHFLKPSLTPSVNHSTTFIFIKLFVTLSTPSAAAG